MVEIEIGGLSDINIENGCLDYLTALEPSVEIWKGDGRVIRMWNT